MMSGAVHWGCVAMRGSLEEDTEEDKAPQFVRDFHCLQAQFF